MHALRSALDSFFFPQSCGVCGQCLQAHEKELCWPCFWQLPVTDHQLRPFRNPVASAFTGRFPVHRAAAFLHFEKGGAAQKLMHRIKYQNRRPLAVHLGASVARLWRESHFFDSLDALVPVPATAAKRKKRGYNQSEALAEGLAQILRLPCRNKLLHRKRQQRSQTELDRFQRAGNVERSIGLQSKLNLRGQRLLLVDDVITTGATAEACLSALKRSGAEELSFFALAYAE